MGGAPWLKFQAMGAAPCRIYPAWKDVIVYDEGSDRTLRFDAEGVAAPFQVSVPAAARWAEKMPEWAQGRRALILERLRAAHCLICEVDHWLRSIQSPEGGFRVEFHWEPDERGALPRKAIRIILNEGPVVLVHLEDAGQAGAIGFPGPNVVLLPFEVQGWRQEVGVNVLERTFWFHPTGERRPLDQLPGVIVARRPPDPVPTRVEATPTSGWSSGVQLLGCGLFIAVGLWQGFVGNRLRDRFLGGAGVLFFGICAWILLGEVLRRTEPRKDPPA